ncbi:MAG: cell division protein FtsL [Alphaproteobacteria bacterium CG11_big_fil_rev_8_21_14_0_20_44_7]|nr:MAG: cell division protein FtsL [Alphaproteobacteria bacterium CG11_big_fil_rev_8_21_14_0_20_44_7]
MSKTIVTWLLFILPVAMGLFYVKHIVQNLEEDLAALERSIDVDQEEVHVLKAEWTYLSRPERVKTLASKYLDLEPTTSRQIADVQVIPFSIGEGKIMTSSVEIK